MDRTDRSGAASGLEHSVRMPVGERKPIPLLLLHGAWHGAWCYDLWLEDFAAHGYETHVMSLPAHGKSLKNKPINLYSTNDYAAAVAEIVSHITPTPFVIGHSMGGFILQHYLKNHTLPAAVLLASAPVNGWLAFLVKYFIKHPLRMSLTSLLFNAQLMLNTPALAREYLLTNDAALTPDALTLRLQSESFRTAVEVALFIRGAPRRVKTPILVVAAERDAIFTLQEQHRTADAYHADFLLIQDQGHNLMMERDWRQTAAKIRTWLDPRQPG